VATSSLGCPFLVLSDGVLVEGLAAPTGEQLRALLGVAARAADALLAGGEAVVMDYEGEMPGHGGELSTAALLPTLTVDRELRVYPELPGATALARVTAAPAQRESRSGLLVDLRFGAAVQVLRRVLECPEIPKLGWGCDCDFMSLLYQGKPFPLGVTPCAAVDVQLAFSTPDRRLGMKRALEKIHRKHLTGLPAKEQVDFDHFHSQNRRALTLPLPQLHAAYAMDDLHRIEAILRRLQPGQQGRPPGPAWDNIWSLRAAREQTDQVLAGIEADPVGMEAIRSQLQWFEAAEDGSVKKTVKAVELKRRVLSARSRGGHDSLLDSVEASVDAVLDEAGVTVHPDLSFNEEAEDKSHGYTTKDWEEWIANIDNAHDREEESQEFTDEQWDQWYQEHGGDSSKDFYDEEGKLWRYDAEAGRHGEADWYDDDGNRWTYDEEPSRSEKEEVAAVESQYGRRTLPKSETVAGIGGESA